MEKKENHFLEMENHKNLVLQKKKTFDNITNYERICSEMKKEGWRYEICSAARNTCKCYN